MLSRHATPPPDTSDPGGFNGPGRRLAFLLPSTSTAWLVLFISLAITLIGAWRAHELVQEHAQDRFEYEVDKACQAILKRMQEYEQVLRGGVGLFISSSEVTRADWRNFVTNLSLDTYWPGIQGLGYSVMLTPAELPSHIQSVRKEGFPEYIVYPAGPRETYSSILYLEPFSGRNLRAFGYDMFADPTRQAAMIRARDTGYPSLSGKVTLVQETGQDVQAGLLMYMPLYRPGVRLDSPAQRQAAHYGYVYSAFRMGDLMQGILGPDTRYLDFDLFDGPASGTQDLLLRARSHPEGQVLNPSFQTQRKLEIAGRTWTAQFSSSRALESETRDSQPWVIALGGLVVDLLLFALLRSFALSHRQANQANQVMKLVLDQQRLSASVFHNAREGILITDAEARILDVNGMFTELTGFSRDEVLGRNPRLLASGRHDRLFYAAMWDALLARGHWSGEIWNRHKNGQEYIERLNISAVRNETGQTTHYVGLFSDVTDQKHYQMQMEFMAQHDALTGLPNRVLLMDRLEVTRAQVHRQGSQMAVAYLDLDGFKPINDQLGHDAGDQALVEVAQRLKACVRAGDTVARIGGDEFVLILVESHAADTEVALARACQTLAQPYKIRGHTMHMTASIGYTLYPEDDATCDTLRRHADQAMYQAKEMGRNRVVRYTARGG